ncbi:MAG: RNB domain-containing ribonuclease, partial [Microcystis sp. M53600_WE12]|nr:RNB domain-containing ribonuclease [Microcystis sp. M53600_WE12]
MDKGTLVEFRVQGERRLGVIDRPEGKKDWIVIDQGGNPHKLRPQRFDYIIKAGPSNYKEIGNFLREVQPYLDASGLEVAWELLAGENQLVTPETMAEILFSDRSPQFCYAAHCLLSDDKVYFKNKGDGY